MVVFLCIKGYRPVIGGVVLKALKKNAGLILQLIINAHMQILMVDALEINVYMMLMRLVKLLINIGILV